jgi:L,D-peptidoglycan transpeptidase YkuD (ErfK/YbiS/YcfS/YnhG family)
MLTRRHFLLGGLTASTVRAQDPGFRLPTRTSQAVVGLADGWNSSAVSLQRYERAGGGPWRAMGPPWPARLGASGLVWGCGLSPAPPGARIKSEGDRRAPAGVFGIGGAWGYDPAITRHPDLPYLQVSSRDLWVEDPQSPHYNQHLLLDHEPRTPWEFKQQMKQGDAAHALKLLILHNTPPNAVPGQGSAIFFHIWRAGGSKPTSGCTAMSEPILRELIRWINPRRIPVYILLPRAEYARLRGPWALP